MVGLGNISNISYLTLLSTKFEFEARKFDVMALPLWPTLRLSSKVTHTLWYKKLILTHLNTSLEILLKN